MLSVVSHGADDTAHLGETLGRLVRAGDFIALSGDLGSGKTHFTQGLARGLGVGPEVCVASPSYTLLNEYMGRIPLYHFDLYRLDGDGDVRELGFDEYFSGRGVCVVEWADRLHSELPDEYLKIIFTVTGDTIRRIGFIGEGSRYEELVRELAALLGMSI
jgi:tRNA threonylcarbamoyladenosine biosynthesis protein TsaE